MALDRVRMFVVMSTIDREKASKEVPQKQNDKRATLRPALIKEKRLTWAIIVKLIEKLGKGYKARDVKL